MKTIMDGEATLMAPQSGKCYIFVGKMAEP